MRLREFAPARGGNSGDYLKALASAWYNGVFDTGSLPKGIKTQEDVERLLNRGIVCPDGRTRKLHIDYNSDFDGVEIYSDDYYEHGDLDGNDGRTGQPWGPYDHMEFKDEELDESLTEVDRRGFLKGVGAAAVTGAAGGAKADRFWQQDELTKQFQGQMTSETFDGAVIHWDEERKIASLALTKPTNFSIHNIKQNRLYFPKFTSTNFIIKIGDSNPINGYGVPYQFPLRQLGDYKGHGLTLFSGSQFTKIRDEFVTADKVLVRVEVDSQPTTMTFYDNPGLIQQRQSQKKQPVLDKIYQEEKAGGRISGFHGIYSAVELRSMLEPFKDQIPEKFKALDQEINTLVSNSQGHQIAKDIEEQIKTENFLKNTKEYKQAFTVERINDWLRSVYPESMSRLKKYNSMLSQVNESVNQGVAEGSLNEFAPDSNDGGEEDALHKYARMWWAGDEATQMQIERALAKMGWEIGEDEGSYDSGGVFVVRAGDINGNSYVSWPAEELTEGSDPWGSPGRFVGDTGPAQLTTTVPRHEFRAGDRVMYKPTGARATIENLYKNGTVARIHVASGMGGKYFDAKVADLRPIGQGLAESHDLCNVCGQTPCNCTHLSEEFDLIESIVEKIAVHNGVDADVIWEDLESLSDDELYVFAVTSEPIMEDWQKVNKQDRTSGMSSKAVKAYRREHPGSKLKTAVTTKPSKLKRGSKASKRRKSYCSRSRGQMKMHNISCAKTPDKAICKARRRWNC